MFRSSASTEIICHFICHHSVPECHMIISRMKFLVRMYQRKTITIISSAKFDRVPPGSKLKPACAFSAPCFIWCKTCNCLAGKFSSLGRYFLIFGWKVSRSKVYIYQPNIRLEVQEKLQ